MQTTREIQIRTVPAIVCLEFLLHRKKELERIRIDKEAELLIREMRERAGRREKAKVERETMLQKRHDDQMALENRRLDAMMLLISSGKSEGSSR